MQTEIKGVSMAPVNNQDGTLWNNACGSPTYFNKEVFMPKAVIHFKKRVLEKNNSLDFFTFSCFPCRHLFVQNQQWKHQNNANNCSTLTKKTPEQRHWWRRSGFLLLALNKFHSISFFCFCMKQTVLVWYKYILNQFVN